MWERLVEWFRIVYTMDTPRGTFIARTSYAEARDHLIVIIIMIIGLAGILAYFIYFYKENDECH